MTFIILQPTVITNTNMITINPTHDMLNCKMVEIENDTSYAFQVFLPGGKQSYMPPQTIKFFAGTDWYGDSIRIIPIVVSSGSWTQLPQKIIVVGFRKDEVTPEDGTVQNINKMAIIGNTVTVTGTMNELQNDNNPAGTTILETTVSGQASSNQTATNDGLWNLGVIISNTIVQFLKSNNIDPILALGALSHTVEILGSETVDQNLTVKGTSSLDNAAITTNGSGAITAVSETLNGAGTALTVNNNATVSGTATLANASITGTGTIATASITGNETVAGTLGVTGATTLSSTLSVSGDATLSGAGTGLAVTNNETVGGTLGVTGVATLSSNTTVGGTLGVTGATTLSSTLTVSGDASLNGAGTGLAVANNETVGGTLGVTGVTTLSSNTTVGGTLGVTGVATLSSNSTVGGTLGVTGVATLSSNTTVGGTLGVTGTATLSSTLTVSGDATLNGAGTGLAVTNNETVGGTLGVTGVTTLSSNTTVGGTLGVTGTATLSSTLTVTGDATFNGAGNSISTAHNAAISGNLSVTGTSSLDNANITSDGSGNLTLALLKSVGSTVSFNGNTAGNGVLYQIFAGTGFKLVYCHVSSFNNSGGTNTDVALPVAFLEGADFFCSNIGQIQAMASGVAQTFQIVTALAAAGGTNTNQTTLNNYSWAHVGGTSIDTIRFSSGIAGAHSGVFLMFGR